MLKALPSEIAIDKDSFREWIHGDMYKDQLPLIRESLSKGRPFGRPAWVELMVEEHGLEYTMRNCGRPRKFLN